MRRRSWWLIAWQRFKSNKLAMFGVFLIGVYALAAVLLYHLGSTVMRDTIIMPRFEQLERDEARGR